MMYWIHPCSPQRVKCLWSTPSTRGWEHSKLGTWASSLPWWYFRSITSNPKVCPRVGRATERSKECHGCPNGTHVSRNFKKEKVGILCVNLFLQTHNHTHTHTHTHTHIQTQTLRNRKMGPTCQQTDSNRNLSDQICPGSGKIQGSLGFPGSQKS